MIKIGPGPITNMGQGPISYLLPGPIFDMGPSPTLNMGPSRKIKMRMAYIILVRNSMTELTTQAQGISCPVHRLNTLKCKVAKRDMEVLAQIFPRASNKLKHLIAPIPLSEGTSSMLVARQASRQSLHYEILCHRLEAWTCIDWLKLKLE